jgi:RNA polymerase sigma-70 factor, ECF subfamily
MTDTAKRTGDAHEQVERLYLAHHRPILAYLRRMVGDHETAEDLCQETFLKALRGWMQHDPQASAIGWLYRIATNTAYDSLRRRQRCAPLSAAELAPDEVASEARIVDNIVLRAALAGLPPSYRTPLLLASGGYSPSELAGAFGCSVPAIRMRIYRARAHLRQIEGFDA